LNERDVETLIDSCFGVDKYKNYIDNPCLLDRNVFKQYQHGKLRVDYVFKSFDGQTILAVLEVKKPNSNLRTALDQSINYARKVNASIALATDGNVFFSHHLKFNRECEIFGKPISELPTYNELVNLQENYFYYPFKKGQLIKSQKDLSSLLDEIDKNL
jgi:hypothetical protein